MCRGLAISTINQLTLRPETVPWTTRPMSSGVHSMRKLANLAALLLLLGGGPAFGFDYARYQPADLDALLAEHRPRSGIDLHGVRLLKLKVALVGYGEACETSALKKSLDTAGVAIDLATHPIT